MYETIQIEGLEEEIPEEAREKINDKIHGVLREDHDIWPKAVYWLEPVWEDDEEEGLSVGDRVIMKHDDHPEKPYSVEEFDGTEFNTVGQYPTLEEAEQERDRS